MMKVTDKCIYIYIISYIYIIYNMLLIILDNIWIFSRICIITSSRIIMNIYPFSTDLILLCAFLIQTWLWMRLRINSLFLSWSPSFLFFTSSLSFLYIHGSFQSVHGLECMYTLCRSISSKVTSNPSGCLLKVAWSTYRKFNYNSNDYWHIVIDIYQIL